jgi:hypothetical protein
MSRARALFRFAFPAAIGLVAIAAAVLPAAARAAGPGWMIAADADGTAFKPSEASGRPRYIVVARNVGSLPAHGTPIMVTDRVPDGLTITEVDFGSTHTGLEPSSPLCSHTESESTCTPTETVAPEEKLVMVVHVSVSTEPSALGPVTNFAKVSGGGAAADSVETANIISPEDSPFAIASLSMRVGNTAGAQDNEAGAHPYETTTTFFMNTFNDFAALTFGQSLEREVKDTIALLPPGLIGNPTVTPEMCTLQQLGVTHENFLNACPAASQVGTINPYGSLGTFVLHSLTDPIADLPLYNIVPEKGHAAEFGFTAGGNNIIIYADVVPSAEGYVIQLSSPGIQRVEPLLGVTATFFGNPGARDGTGSTGPFLANGADCSAPGQTLKLLADLWQEPGGRAADGSPDLSDPNWKVGETTLPQLTGCEKLAGLFKPTIEARPETNRADSPTGVEVDLKVPQSESSSTLATPPLRKAVVTLPAGLTVNPSSANGLQGCSLSDLGMSPSGQANAAPPHCPDASKIGEVELETPDVKGDPKLGGALQGQIYVAKQGENPFHSLLAIYIVVDDPTTGVVVKLPGEVRPNAETGQLETVVDNSPQFPFSELRTHFFGGAKAPLRTPAVCGKYAVTSSLTPWSAPASGPPATPAGSFSVSQSASGEGACPESAAEEPAAFAFEAGTVSPIAGAYSPFVVRLKRADGTQELSGLDVALPQGLLGKLAGVQECSEAQLAVARSREREGGGAEELASPSCPAASEVGRVTVGAGAGLTPFYTTGRAYLAGPYKGAPLSLAIITPAVAGPFDLGDVVVRVALHVDPYTAQIHAVSDPLPHILDGIPLDIRSVALQMDRPNFTLNPTNCEAKQITAQATTVLGASAALQNRFQVGECRKLAFKPKLRISLTGKTQRTGHPALKAVLTYPKKGSYANIGFAQVGLPHSEFLDQGNLGNVCTQPELASGTCPASSVYGHAKAWTPLLDKPLEGNVYLGVGFGHVLPDLVAELNGQIRVLLHAKVDTDKEDGLRSTFEVVPDAPVEKFVLEMKGGKKYGLLTNSGSICAKPRRVSAKFIAQNGEVDVMRPLIHTSCKAKGKGKKHRHHKRR